MKRIALAGRGLACSLGLGVTGCVSRLRSGQIPQPVSRTLPGDMGEALPYYAIPFDHSDWYARARQLVECVAAEAQADRARDGVLFVATTSFDVGAKESFASPDQFDGYGRFLGRVSDWLGWRGPVYGVNTACNSSLNAALAASALLRTGQATDALVLGIELENSLTLGGFAALQLLSRTSAKPFGAARDGLVLGEAVAALRLSTREQADWHLLGGANVVDGSQPTGVSPPALADMYRQALAASGLAAEDIDLIKVQAAGSPVNDAAEAAGLLAAFRPVPALVSLKGVVGHAMGASGAAEIALLLACLEQAICPPYPHPVDPALGVDFAPWPTDVRRVLATILGFGGGHASVVLERA